ncbi:MULTISPECIES: ethanolamine ammonia-lyase subunit EutC [unclassified Shewanella]|jgi:ethanolamine ammonia-lyase small subunit|uniref:ethanolamine ammonia-lyase subunit EutC n=1 Tax=unclassified Shewanella TaxID=196818 RepID=UPI000C33B0A9|nr:MULTISPECIES: ethanolamine ammonia-lyase subunit EutC [unclassified Shewanella]MBO1895447.1 ethanolamine ammonia-lyase subunit EutC [Shewanella sp. BF02_Schw]PKH32671.1 ethanolamine ammonia-lyase [Shewanella sp. ALD9]|tara:strand:+ start:3008 stop:3901 length:894 start_codon:yes stop_codon:yes gene_type:complete
MDSNCVDKQNNLVDSIQSHHQHGNVVSNPWRDLRRFTDARIGLGRAGISLPTSELLAFQLSHAQARDAVNLPLNIDALAIDLSNILLLDNVTYPMTVNSQVDDRITYLQRPDLGRKLAESGRKTLLHHMNSQGQAADTQYDLAIVVVDGLSSLAVQNNAKPFINELLSQLHQQHSGWNIAPITIVEQGRVAIGDDIGQLLNAQVVMVLIGERPGLSSPDSLGLYLTWAPKTGLNDACRNCISNIRPAGLPYTEAAKRAVYLLTQAKKLKLTGVNLKDRTQDDVIEHQQQTQNFLIAE